MNLWTRRPGKYAALIFGDVTVKLSLKVKTNIPIKSYSNDGRLFIRFPEEISRPCYFHPEKVYIECERG
ncbi:hypothetical protein ACV242_001370 [Peribacillus simplex]